jgi:hypothetical protein
VEVEDLFKEPGAGALIVPKREAAPEETVAAWFVERCGDDLLIRPLQEVRDRAEDWSLANILGAITRLSLCNRAARAAMNDPNQSLDRSLHQGLREARRGYRDRLIELMNAGQLKAQREGRIEDYDRAIGEALLLSGADSEE